MDELVTMAFLLQRIKSILKIPVLLLVSLAYYLVSSRFGDPNSAAERLALIHKSLIIIRESPVFGVGLGNSILAASNHFLTSNYRLYTQPVHNIYLLLTSEVGLPAALFFFYFIFKNTKTLLVIGEWKLIIPVAAFLATGLVDHYWLTLHQNQLLLILLLALLHAQITKSSPNEK